jgi:hypothetical protein
MNFGQALEHIKQGKPVRREKWPEGVILLLTHSATPEPDAEPVLVLARRWSFKGDDLLADDWTLVEGS